MSGVGVDLWRKSGEILVFERFCPFFYRGNSQAGDDLLRYGKSCGAVACFSMTARSS
jgi:hypothetical protein